MESHSKTIGPLKQVALLFTAGTTAESKDLISVPQPLEFIFGIGTKGLTQFECALDGKQSGDKGIIEVDPKKAVETFGHILGCIHSFPNSTNIFYFHYDITGISDASPREVVKSMAAATTADGGGCGDDCGCGCG